MARNVIPSPASPRGRLPVLKAGKAVKAVKAVKAAKSSPGDREVCPKCGRPNARIIGRSESFPILYLRCDGCSHTSVAPA
jgi:hypothetical protein